MAALILVGLSPASRAIAAAHYQTLKSFGYPDPQGKSPRAPLIQGSDGELYGTTTGEGGDQGNVFKLHRDGSGFTLLHRFGSTGDGRIPVAGLMQGSDGVLYGTTYYGGTNDSGTVFRLNKDGSGYTVLRNFGSTPDGQNPSTTLLEGSDGALYGTAASGGNPGSVGFPPGSGTVFKLNKDGSGFATLHNFSTNGVEGQNPRGLIEGKDGALYGTTAWGGSSKFGTVFKLNEDGFGYAILHSFSNTLSDGWSPVGLIEGSDGVLYGTTGTGGSNYDGTVFRLNKDGSAYAILHSFPSVSGDGLDPGAGLVEGSDGALYGTTYGTLYYGSGHGGSVFKLNKDGRGYSVLYGFPGVFGDSQGPSAALIEGSDGVLYGTTPYGGADNIGSIFKLNKDGNNFALVHSFRLFGDGWHPAGGVVEGSDGALYGTTSANGSDGGGTVFRLNQDGSSYAVLHNFSTVGSEGQAPQAPLIEASDGALFGTTSRGGSNNAGTIFRLTKDGTRYTTLHSFESTATTGTVSPTGLVEGRDGTLYGITYDGGSNNAGTVFRLSKDGTGYGILHEFGSVADGVSGPQAGLAEGSDGALYGTTSQGGSNNAGTVFCLNKDGSGYRLLHYFDPSAGDGFGSQASLVEGSDGALYGTTSLGGSNIFGTVFRVNKDGSGYFVLHRFDSPGDGRYPQRALLEGADGALYGTTATGGGNNNAGTVFRLGKDGSDYAILYAFSSVGGDGWNPSCALVRAGDGAFYGTASNGGDLGFGTVFKLWPPQTPDMIGVTLGGNTAQVIFAGMSAYHYHVLRSTDLTNWTALPTITMPVAGIYTNSDSSLPASAAYYRAVWVP